MSIDFRGNPHSSILDAPYTSVMDGDFVKVLSWYDNEWGYSSRCVDLLRFMRQEGALIRVAHRNGHATCDLARARGCSSASTSTCRSRTARSATTRASARRCRRSRYALEQGATVILASHLGPAEGQAEPGVLAAAGGRPALASCSAGRSRSPRTASASRREAAIDAAPGRAASCCSRTCASTPRRRRTIRRSPRQLAALGRRLRQRRVRLGASRARLDRGHRPPRQGGGRRPADGRRRSSTSAGCWSTRSGRSSRSSAAPRSRTSSR